MAGYSVYLVDTDYDTHEFVASYTDYHDAYARADVLREEIESDGDSDTYRVDVVEEKGLT